MLQDRHEVSDLQNLARQEVYDSLIWKEVGESCLLGFKGINMGCHENMASNPLLGKS
jgi:hypothetical protein